ncbi:MAG: histone deacetylase family protein [Rhodanobacteraceae bacterium]
MSTAIYTHAACLAHDTGPGHPESPARLAAVLEALDDPKFAALVRIEAPLATREQLARVHDAELVDALLDMPIESGLRRLDPDTVMSPGSAEAAARAAGAVCAAIDDAISGTHRRAFCAVRPPGHHATRDTPMGFCLFNSVAAGAAHAIAAHGLARVAIVDFDVHHGNGTQDIFWSDPRVLYASSHQFPLYPGTGARDETGVGNIVNAPLRPNAGSADFRKAYEETVLPAIEKFAPELVLISAGFDAHRLDPLANLALEADDYAWITAKLVALASRHANGRVVSSLEGGYSLSALRESTAAHVAALEG